MTRKRKTEVIQPLSNKAIRKRPPKPTLNTAEIGGRGQDGIYYLPPRSPLLSMEKNPPRRMGPYMFNWDDVYIGNRPVTFAPEVIAQTPVPMHYADTPIPMDVSE